MVTVTPSLQQQYQRHDRQHRQTTLRLRRRRHVIGGRGLVMTVEGDATRRRVVPSYYRLIAAGRVTAELGRTQRLVAWRQRVNF